MSTWMDLICIFWFADNPWQNWRLLHILIAAMLVNFALHELKETNEIKVEEEGEKKIVSNRASRVRSFNASFGCQRLSTWFDESFLRRELIAHTARKSPTQHRFSLRSFRTGDHRNSVAAYQNLPTFIINTVSGTPGYYRSIAATSSFPRRDSKKKLVSEVLWSSWRFCLRFCPPKTTNNNAACHQHFREGWRLWLRQKPRRPQQHLNMMTRIITQPS